MVKKIAICCFSMILVVTNLPITVGATATYTQKTEEASVEIEKSIEEQVQTALEWVYGEDNAKQGNAIEESGNSFGKPVAMPVVIGEEVDEIIEDTDKKVIKPFSVVTTYAVKTSSTVSTKKAFMKQLHDNLTARKKSFNITFKGSYSKIYTGDIEKMFSQAWNIDDKTTSDDFDYLYPNIETYAFNILAYSSNKSVFSFKITYRESATQMKKVNKKVKAVLKKLKLTKLTRKEKVKKIHDYIVNLITYDRTLTKYTAYAGLVNSQHTTVCQGYALLAYKMLTDAGVSCRYVTGYAGTGHAWNIVKLGSKWYHLDVTWDDPVSNVPQLSYDYFLVGSQTIREDHTLDSKFQTSSFQKKYPISAKDFVWKDTTTPLKEEVASLTRAKENFNKGLTAVLDEQLKYEEADEYLQMLYDLYKQIICDVIRAMPQDTFYQMKEEKEGTILTLLVSIADEKITEQITNPLLQYLDSEECQTAYMTELLEDYTREQLAELTETELRFVLEKYIRKVFKKKFSVLSKKYSASIVDETLQTLLEKATGV